MESNFYENLLAGQLAVACHVLCESNSFIKNDFISCASYCDRENDFVAITPIDLNINELDKTNVLVYRLSTAELLQGKRESSLEINLHIDFYKKHKKVNSLFRIYTDSSLILSNSEFYNNKTSKNNFEKIEFLSEYIDNMLEKYDVSEKGFLPLPKWGVLVWDNNAFRLAMKVDEVDRYCKIINSLTLGNRDNYSTIFSEVYNNYSNEKAMITKPISGCSVTPEEQQNVNFELLCYFDEICRKNNIKYSLTGGTLLGAIRQRGFIPWDDDADVFLARPEYEKLEKAFPDNNRYILMNSKKDNTFPYVYSRLLDTKSYITFSPNTLSAGRGLFLDICVIDGLPRSKFKRNNHIRKMHFFFSCRRATIHSKNSPAYRKRSIWYKIAWNAVLFFTTTKAWNRRIYRNISKYSFDNSEYVGNFTSQYGKKEMMHRSCFDSYIDVPFENHLFMICEGYEEYLSNIYGDYYALPIPENRKGHHENNCVWINDDRN